MARRPHPRRRRGADAGGDACALLDELRANPDVEYAEPDYIRTRSGEPMTPSDPMFP